MSNGNSLQRNQRPAEAVVTIGERNQMALKLIDPKTGLAKGKKISVIDNAGNSLHICENIIQADYMYNKDLTKAVSVINQRIAEQQKIIDRLVGLEIKHSI